MELKGKIESYTHIITDQSGNLWEVGEVSDLKGVIEFALNDFFTYLDDMGDRFDSNSLDGHKRDWLKLFSGH
jgi:hypothetical protein